jgi:hypothetical protein
MPTFPQDTAFELNTMNPVLQELYTNMLKPLGFQWTPWGMKQALNCGYFRSKW